MCLILFKPKSAKLPKMFFKDVYSKNKDGFGFMYRKEDPTAPGGYVLVTEKIVTKNWEECYELYLPHEDNDMCLHWRMRTHGPIDETNAHPHVLVDDELYMVHNGTFAGYYTNTAESDTIQWNNDILIPYLTSLADRDTYLPTKACDIVMKKLAGDHNKIVIMSKKGFTFFGTFFIANEKYIDDLKGIIFSNEYAWNGDYWHKDARENEINKGFVTPSQNHTSTHNSSTKTNIDGVWYGMDDEDDPLAHWPNGKQRTTKYGKALAARYLRAENLANRGMKEQTKKGKDRSDVTLPGQAPYLRTTEVCVKDYENIKKDVAANCCLVLPMGQSAQEEIIKAMNARTGGDIIYLPDRSRMLQ